jgi:DNA repair exonuclease SbcCD ATPase subunit
LRATEDQLNQTKDDLTANRGKLSQTEGDLRAVQEKLSHTENTLTTAQGKLNQTEGDLKTTQDKLSQTENTLTATLGKLNQTANDLGATRDKLSQTENTLTATLGKLNQTANDLRATQEKLKDTETDLMATRDRLKQAEGDLAEKNSKIAGFESRFGGFDSAVDSFVEIMEKTFSCESTKTILSVIGVTRDNMRRTEVILKFIRLFGPEFTYAAKIYNNMRDFKKANRTGVMDAEKQLISTLNQFHRDIDKVEFDILELTDVSKPETLFDKLAMQDFDKPADITFRYIDSIYVPALRKDAATIQFKAFIKGIR